MLIPSNNLRSRIFGLGPLLSITLVSIAFISVFYLGMSTAGHSDPVPVGSGSGKVQDFHYKFTVQKGFFQQSEDETDDKEFDFKTSNFGLINRTYSTDSDEDKEKGTQWQRFEKYIRSLETSKQAGESYKVLFLGRHGQGWHNVAETKYGTKAWDVRYSFSPLNYSLFNVRSFAKMNKVLLVRPRRRRRHHLGRCTSDSARRSPGKSRE